MIRTQIQVTEEELKNLRQMSAKTGKSISELIRSGIDQYLAGKPVPTPEDRIERAIRLAGMFASGSPDVSRNHDRHLAEAFRE